MIRAHVAEHPDRRFVAFSEEADEFWASLGWEQFLNVESPEVYRRLFTGRPASRVSRLMHQTIAMPEEPSCR